MHKVPLLGSAVILKKTAAKSSSDFQATKPVLKGQTELLALVSILIFALVTIAPANLPAGEPLVINTWSRPPLSTLLRESLSEAFGRMGYKMVLQELPGERALINANQGINDGDAARIFELSKAYPNLVRVPENIIDVQLVAFSRNVDFATIGWKSLRPYNVGIVKGYKILEINIIGTKSLVKVKNIEKLFTLLHKDRADLVVTTRMGGLAAIKGMGLSGIKVLQPPLAISTLYPHLNVKHKNLVPGLAAAIREIKRDGTYQRLYDEIMGPYLPSQSGANKK